MEYIIVQAGGRGSRLKHLTENKPKALVPVENLPMLFHLFKKFPEKKFIIISDYKKDVLRRYLQAFSPVKYLIVEAGGNGTCAGIGQAVSLLPDHSAFMLVWSDLILPEGFALPEEYEYASPTADYIGISGDFSCRWKYESGEFAEAASKEHGVAGFFLFADKRRLDGVPESGELVRWMQKKKLRFRELSLRGTREFGLLSEYEKLDTPKCRYFNRMTVKEDRVVKEPTNEQGAVLARRERSWYQKAAELKLKTFPQIFGTEPLEMERIRGGNIYEQKLSRTEKERVLEEIIAALKLVHASDAVPGDPFSVKNAYFSKTIERLLKIENVVPFARDRFITVNGKPCRNVFFFLPELEARLEQLRCGTFSFIHGDCTFSNIMLRENGEPVLIDPRGYFGFTELYGDIRYDWAKLYYSIAGNYDQFNLKRFRLSIGDSPEQGVTLKIDSNHWEDMEDFFFRLTGADEEEIRLLHAVIWLSLTTYTWEDYDSICGAFYNGIYYLEDVL